MELSGKEIGIQELSGCLIVALPEDFIVSASVMIELEPKLRTLYGATKKKILVMPAGFDIYLSEVRDATEEETEMLKNDEDNAFKALPIDPDELTEVEPQDNVPDNVVPLRRRGLN